MSETLVKNISVKTSPEKAFAFIANPKVLSFWKGWGKWPAIKEVIEDGPLAVGQISRIEHVDGTVIENEVLEMEPGRRYKNRVKHLSFPISLMIHNLCDTWEFESHGDETKIRRTLEFTYKDNVLSFLIGQKVLARHMERALETHLKDVAQRLTE